MDAGRIMITLLALALTITGCGDGGSPGSAEEVSLRGRTFLSDTVTENGQPRQLAERTRVRFQFTDDGRLIADAGCNLMQGPVSLRDGRLELSELTMTEMGCDGPAQEQDSWLHGLLAGKPSWRLDDPNLVVSSEATELVMIDRNVADPDLTLQDIQWSVDTILEGDTASSSPPGAPATLVFDKDTVTVSTGCNSGAGSYRLSGSTIRFDGVALTKKACEPERMTLEGAVLAVLTGEVSYEVDADQLTLKHPSGKGLRLRGQKG